MKIKVYAGRALDRNILEYSSSGGAFTILSDEFINRGNAVLCAGYNYKTHRTEHRLVFTVKERDACRGSMYMQSYALNSWCDAEKWLRDNQSKELIFFGLGCQGAGFIRFCEMKGILNRVTVVDIICHGAPSPMIWKEYAQSIEKEGQLTNINFRDKRTGWAKSIGIAKLNGREISLSKWRRLYSSRTILRPCCSFCPYTTTDRRADITIGDFWHIEGSMPDFYDEMGTSVFLVNTEKGMNLFDRVKSRLDYRESNTEDCWQMNLERPTKHAKERDDFWIDYRRRGIDYVVNKYGTLSLKTRLKRRLRKIIRQDFYRA